MVLNYLNSSNSKQQASNGLSTILIVMKSKSYVSHYFRQGRGYVITSVFCIFCLSVCEQHYAKNSQAFFCEIVHDCGLLVRKESTKFWILILLKMAKWLPFSISVCQDSALLYAWRLRFSPNWTCQCSWTLTVPGSRVGRGSSPASYDSQSD